MAWYAGRAWKREELLARIGDPLQAAGVRGSILTDGKADGVRAFDVDTGGGLRFTVLPGRGMDIPFASHKGTSLGFFSGTGITSPAYYQEPGLDWRRGFYAGMLTTCGISNAGAPSTDEGRPFGLHGRLSNAAAENLCVEQEWEGDEFIIRLKGTMRETEAMVENLALTRCVETRLGAAGFRIRDTVFNRGFSAQPLMLLYHINFGFPLLSPSARIVGPIQKTEPRDEQARAGRGLEECLSYPEPVPDYGFVFDYRSRAFFIPSVPAPTGRHSFLFSTVTPAAASRWAASSGGTARSFRISPNGKCRAKGSTSSDWSPGPSRRSDAASCGRRARCR